MDSADLMIWAPYLVLMGVLAVFPLTRRLLVWSVVAILALLAFCEPDLRD